MIPAVGFSRDPGQFKTMPMQMHGMDVVAGIAHAQPIALALAQMKHRLHFVHRERHVVDAPFVEALVGGVVLGERHLDGFIRRLARRTRLSETRIIPFERSRLGPFRLSGFAGIFDHNAHAPGAVVIGKVAHHPYAGMVHLDHRRYTFGGPQPEHRYLASVSGRDCRPMRSPRSCAPARRGCGFRSRCR